MNPNVLSSFLISNNQKWNCVPENCIVFRKLLLMTIELMQNHDFYLRMFHLMHNQYYTTFFELKLHPTVEVDIYVSTRFGIVWHELLGMPRKEHKRSITWFFPENCSRLQQTVVLRFISQRPLISEVFAFFLNLYTFAVIFHLPCYCPVNSVKSQYTFCSWVSFDFSWYTAWNNQQFFSMQS